MKENLVRNAVWRYGFRECGDVNYDELASIVAMTGGDKELLDLLYAVMSHYDISRGEEIFVHAVAGAFVCEQSIFERSDSIQRNWSL